MEIESAACSRGRAGLAAVTLWLVALAAVAPALQAAEDPLVLGIFPRYKAIETTTLYTPLADYLGERLGRKVALATSKDFNSFWKEVTERRYDIVYYNQYHYVHSARNYRVVAHTQESGKGAIAAALYVRKDSGITQMSQLRNRTIIFGGGRDAMMSYIAPRFMLMQAGLKEEDFKTEFAVNPPNALLALYHRQADAAGAGETLIDLPVVRNAINADELVVLSKTEPLLFLPWAVKRSMPAKLREPIQTLLTELDRSDKGKKILQSIRATGIGKAEDKDYDPHRKMTAAVFGPKGTAN